MVRIQTEAAAKGVVVRIQTEAGTQYLIQLLESLEDGLDPERRPHNIDQLEVERVAMEEDGEEAAQVLGVLRTVSQVK